MAAVKGDGKGGPILRRGEIETSSLSPFYLMNSEGTKTPKTNILPLSSFIYSTVLILHESSEY